VCTPPCLAVGNETPFFEFDLRFASTFEAGRTHPARKQGIYHPSEPSSTITVGDKEKESLLTC
jgi:hypothetical protein